MTLLHRWPLAAGCVLCILTATAQAQAAQLLQKEKLCVGFIRSAFTNVNQSDAEAAFKVFARTVGVSIGYSFDITVQSFADAQELTTIPQTMRPHIVILEAWNFLQMGDADWLEPACVASDRGQIAHRYLLLVGKDSRISSLRDMRGKSANLFFASNAELGLFWLRALLAEHQLGTPEQFFAASQNLSDPMATVLPVFFGKKDVAMIMNSRFEMMAELNPQLKTMKKILASEPLVNGITCLSRTGWTSDKVKEDVRQAFFDLHKSTAGQQILTLFKMDQAVPYKPEQLDSVRALFDKAALQNKRVTAPRE